MDRGSLFFDGHNDVLLQLSRISDGEPAQAFRTGLDGHMDFERCLAGGFAGGLFAVYVPSSESAAGDDDDAAPVTESKTASRAHYVSPLPPPLDQKEALASALKQISILNELEREGCLRICKSVGAIRAAMEKSEIAAVMHMEGADALDRDLDALAVMHRAGLRSLGIVWSRPCLFGQGVPFAFPSLPDIGGGLTDDGIRLVRSCNELGIMVDCSHLTEAGFWDVAGCTQYPLVATHSNVHALCESSRNLTLRQLHAVRDSDGMVGVNFGVSFLRKDGFDRADTPLEDILRHLDFLLAELGETRVGFGSDFDGVQVPNAISDVAGLKTLHDAMVQHGYGSDLLDRLCRENWLRVLQSTWKA